MGEGKGQPRIIVELQYIYKWENGKNYFELATTVLIEMGERKGLPF
jgi:hypothetical protein